MPRWAKETLRWARRGGRRSWRNHDRVHVALRDLSAAELRPLAPVIEATLSRLDGVAWARVNPRLGHVVVQRAGDEHEPTQAALPAEPGAEPSAAKAAEPGSDDPTRALEDRVLAALATIEREAGVNARGFPGAHPEQHPGDPMPIARTLVEIAAEVASLGAGLGLRALGIKPVPLEVDLAALLELVGGLPGARKAVERVATIALTELGLELANAAVQSLLQSEMGPVVGTLHRALRLRELWARRSLWARWEPTLCARPELQPDLDHQPPPRPGELPPGPIERYADKAGTASLGAFALGLMATRSVERASGLLFAGLPKPARYGRDAFSAHLGLRLAQAGVMVMEPHVLRRFDRLDCVLLDPALGDGDLPAVRGLVQAARAAGLTVVAGGLDRTAAARAGISEHTAAGLEGVQALQQRGHGVCVVGRGPSPAYLAADCAIALSAGSEAPGWGAHILCRGDLGDAALLMAAIGAGRAASEQSVHLAMVEAAVGLAMSYTGLDSHNTRRIMSVSNAASILAIGNALRLAAGLTLPAPPETHAGPPPPPWHQMDTDEVLSALSASADGLPERKAAPRRRQPPPEPSPLARWVGMVGAELANPMAPILAAGAGLSILAGQVTDAILVGSALALGGVFGAAQRYHIEKSLHALSRVEQRTVRVRRGGRVRDVDSQALVPGDVVEMSAGEVVPADCRLLEAHGLDVDESSLTGESLPVAKSAAPAPAAAVAERTSMLYAGTAIAAGRAVAVVVAVGDDTEARRALLLSDEPAKASGVEHRLERLISLTAPLAGGSGLALALAGMLRGQPLAEVMGAGVSLAVAAVPEGLPLLATLAQLAAAGRLSERGALARNPRAIEALGRVDVLCADKTGTLTEGKIRLVAVSDGEVEQAPDGLDQHHRRVLRVALRASPSTAAGDPIPHLTDRALVEGAARAEVKSHDDRDDWQRLHELPFEPSRGYHAGLASSRGEPVISAKGAPEVILDRCDRRRLGAAVRALDDPERDALMDHAHTLARQGYRVLAVAERAAHEHTPVGEDRVRDLCFCGFVAFADPVRASARAAVADLRRAGVDILMLTGDHPSTAEAIATELGLSNGAAVITGADLDDLDDDALEAAVGHTSVFARVTPTHKVRIVRALQRAGRVVAMTGDGANDAPAIRLADVGIALGQSSTSAARQAADMVVTDERIETIVHAVLEGRALWTSVRDAVAILVGGNLGEIFYTLAGGLLSQRPPLNVRQLLLVNLITDTFPALAIALRPPVHKRPDELASEGPEVSLGAALTRDITWRAAITAGTASAAWLAARLGGKRGADTVGLLALTGSQLTQTLAAGTRSLPVLATSVGSLLAVLGIVETPGLSQFFGCRPLGPLGLAQATVATALGTGVYLLVPKLWPRRDSAPERTDEHAREDEHAGAQS
ncbi:HAD-IC family P-type ATPase [Haliangium sp.]|uniref:cation-translocating P-type ATPase n=1 Tax=Haliangium sp. TaxID=2663208 RepID=UPI003D0ACCCF